MKRRPRLLLLGSNSGRNAGDAAILQTVIEQISLRRPDAVFEVPTTNPRWVAEHFRGRDVVPLAIMPWNLSLRLLGLPVLKAMKRCDISLILDGIIFDHRLFNPAFNFLNTLYFLSWWTRLVRKPMVCFEVGVGPLATKLGRYCARKVAESADLIMARETDTVRLLAEAGVTSTPVELYADAVFIITPAPEARVDDIIERLGLRGRTLLGLNLNRYGGEWIGNGEEFDQESFQRHMSLFIDRFVEAAGATVVLTATHHMDREYLNSIRRRLKRPELAVVVSNVEYTPSELAGLMGRMDMFMGMRLHSLILASSMKTPIVGLTYAPKVKSLFELMGRPELALDMSRIETEPLLKTVLDFWGRRRDEKARLAPCIDDLKAKAARGFDRLIEKYFP